MEAQTRTNRFVEKDAGDGTNRFDHQAGGIGLAISLASLGISLFLVALDQTIIFTIFEAVGNKWGEYQKVSWISIGYMMGLAMCVQIWGKCSIYFGRKESLLLSIIIFEIGSLISATSPNMDALIVGRVIAGLGGGGVQVLVFIVGSELVPISKRSLLFAFMGIIFSISSIVGPLIGGSFTDKVSWRWCFYINLPLGGSAFLCLTYFFRPPSPTFTWREKFAQIDYVGSFLMPVGIVLLLLPMTLGGQQLAWNSAGIIVMFILSGLFIIAFCIWNFKYSKSQIVPSSLVKSIGIMAPCLTLSFGFFVFMGYSIFLTTYLQVIKGYTAIETGIHFFPLMISMILSTIGTGILIRKTRYIKPYALFACSVGTIGFGISTLMAVDTSIGKYIGLLILPGIGIGMTMQASLMSTQMCAPKENGGVIMATSFTQFTRSLGAAIGTSIFQVVYNTSVAKNLTNAYFANADVFQDVTLSAVKEVAGSPKSLLLLSPAAQAVVKQCIMDAIHNVFYLAIAVSGVTVITSLFFDNMRLPKDQDVEKREDYETEDHDKLAPQATVTDHAGV